MNRQPCYSDTMKNPAVAKWIKDRILRGLGLPWIWPYPGGITAGAPRGGVLIVMADSLDEARRLLDLPEGHNERRDRIEIFKWISGWQEHPIAESSSAVEKCPKTVQFPPMAG